MDHLKAQLIAKEYTQIHVYGDTFSPISKMASTCLFLSMAAISIGPNKVDYKV